MQTLKFDYVIKGIRLPVPFQGRGVCNIRLGDIEALHLVWVADSEPEGIIGLDFIRAFGVELVRAATPKHAAGL